MQKKDDISPELKKVAFEKGTEMPFSGKYLKETASGTYNCAVCQNPLFSSNAKFETKLPGLIGWPSFEDAIAGSVEFVPDNSGGMRRTEVLCVKCKSHLGHIFDDELETKTGKHYCINSVCLDLKKSR